MRYKIIADVNISGNGEGDFFDAEEHAVGEYIAKGQIEEAKPVEKKPAKKVVKRKAKVVVKKK